MIERRKKLDEIHYFLSELFPIVSILGPRQSGKTTLAKQYATQYQGEVSYFDLEKQQDFDRLQDPYLTLKGKKGLIVIDEVQRYPALFDALRVMVDEDVERRFLILGSASPDIIRGVSETLAGRVGFVELSGFHLEEVGFDSIEDLWLRGGFPRSFLSKNNEDSYVQREQFIRTFLERDLGLFKFNIDPIKIRRFWMMLAHYQGKAFNAHELAKSVDIDQRTVKSYVDILEGTYMIRMLRPWFNNTKKRLVKSAKIYFRDTGLLHSLLSLQEKEDVETHPVCGFSWEGFALEEALSLLNLKSEQVYYWAVHNQAELDLLFTVRGKKIGMEFKYTSNPKVDKSMQAAIRELDLDQLFVVFPQGRQGPLAENIYAVPIDCLGGINEVLM